MTPQERDLLTGLFDRLATLENQPRDPEAARAIIEGLRQAPNATYALVQTALVQDEALKRADARIQELEAQLGDAPAEQQASGGFLDNMREALLGPRATTGRGSVPSVQARQPVQDPGPAPRAGFAPGVAPQAGYGPGIAPQPGFGPGMAPQAGFGGGSFLGNAASAAAGVIGGSLLLDGIRSMMGHGGGSFAAVDPGFGAARESGSPWDKAGSGDLGRQAGVDDIGHGQHQDQNLGGDHDTGQGLLDDSQNDDAADLQGDQDQQDQDVAFDDDSGDFGGGDGGDFSNDV